MLIFSVYVIVLSSAAASRGVKDELLDVYNRLHVLASRGRAGEVGVGVEGGRGRLCRAFNCLRSPPTPPHAHPRRLSPSIRVAPRAEALASGLRPQRVGGRGCRWSPGQPPSLASRIISRVDDETVLRRQVDSIFVSIRCCYCSLARSLFAFASGSSYERLFLFFFRFAKELEEKRTREKTDENKNRATSKTRELFSLPSLLSSLLSSLLTPPPPFLLHPQKKTKNRRKKTQGIESSTSSSSASSSLSSCVLASTAW